MTPPDMMGVLTPDVCIVGGGSAGLVVAAGVERATERETEARTRFGRQASPRQC